MAEKLRIHKWDTWQTYRKDRATPPWIKVHRDIFNKPKWANLSDSEKGQLVSLWVLAANSDGYIPSDPKMVRKLCLLDESPDINKFIEMGWIDIIGCQVDVNLTSSGSQSDAPEEKREEEKRVEAEFAFVCGEIKITHSLMDEWRRYYSTIDIPAYLYQLESSEYFATQMAANRRWDKICISMLSKQHQKNLQNKAQEKPKKGVVY